MSLSLIILNHSFSPFILFQFNKWFAEVESNVSEQEDHDVVQYIETLEEVQKQIKHLYEQTSSALDDLKALEENYHFVSNKTNSLHVSCQQLIEEQVNARSYHFL